MKLPATPGVFRVLRPGARRPAGRRGGFTLIELVLAMTIMGLLAGIAVHPLSAVIERARVARAIGEISTIQKEIALYEASRAHLPASLNDIGRGSMLDPWGNLYQYLAFAVTGTGGGKPGKGGGGGGGLGQPRKDHFLHPINSTYDLYSMGADGKSAP
ncbi:MAG: prepilin-type N-terminal cleavage/methylation domain-containing protein, partial [Longimicrobiales bacterium]